MKSFSELTSASQVNNADLVAISQSTGNGYASKKTTVADLLASGGGGTGGHTIINENGTSMTARSGLQFTGDVVVTDDGTNNKTIVSVLSGGGHNYSTDEQIVGTWIDGSTVYEKTLYKQYAFKGNNAFTLANEKILYFEGFGTNTFTQQASPLPYANESDVKNNAIFDHISTTGFDLVLGSNYSSSQSNMYFTDIYVTVRYTKSS